MNRPVVLAITALALSFPSLHESTLFAQYFQPLSSLPAKVDWIKYKIISGRITAMNLRPGTEKEASLLDPQSGIKQRLSIEYLAGSTTIDYQRVSKDENLSIHFKGPHHLTMARQPQGESDLLPLQLTQTNTGKITFTIGHGSSPRQMSANSFWQLMLLVSEADRKRIASTLKLLRPGWRLVAATSELENTMVRLVKSEKLLDPQQAKQIIQQLGSSSFSRRHRAQRRLQQLGPLAMALVSQIDPWELDAEQKRRIQQVVRSLSTSTDDTSAYIAASLVNDRATWMALLSHDIPSHRQAAADRLTTLLGRQLEFDPQARQEMRRVQIQQLRQQIANN